MNDDERSASALAVLVAGFATSKICQQTVPYVSFMSQTLANNFYVDIGHVGFDGSGSNSVKCHTDLVTCCSAAQGVHRGDWYFPSGARLPHIGDGNIVESRGAQRIDLRRSNGVNEPTGIYRCDVQTNAVVTRETVYVGLYTSGQGTCYIPTIFRVAVLLTTIV